MLPSSSAQSNPQHKVADFGFHLLCAGAKTDISKVEAGIFIKTVHLVVFTERESDIMCLSPVRLFIFQYFLSLLYERSSPVPKVQFSEPSGEQNQEVQKNILERGKKAPKAETKDSICQSSEGTRSER